LRNHGYSRDIAKLSISSKKLKWVKCYQYMKSKILFGFHAVIARLRHDASSVEEIYVDKHRVDRRMKEFLDIAKAAGVRTISVESTRLSNIVGTHHHQGIVAKSGQLSLARNLDEVLDTIVGPPLLLVLDGITDPRNLGACLRVADGVGAHAVIVPRDRAVGINATAAKVASGPLKQCLILLSPT